MRATASADAHLYVIDPSGVGTSPPMNGSSGFARETGGHAFLNTNDYNGAVDRIMREAWSYYLITVADPRIRLTSDLRELDVRLIAARHHRPSATRHSGPAVAPATSQVPVPTGWLNPDGAHTWDPTRPPDGRQDSLRPWPPPPATRRRAAT